jgi:hypothetical protein
VTESIDISPRATRFSVRVWRRVAGTQQWLFSYAGAIDDAVLGAVMQHVQRLTSTVPGRWTVEVVGADAHGGRLHPVPHERGHIRRRGRRARVAYPIGLLANERDTPRALALAASPSILVH